MTRILPLAIVASLVFTAGCAYRERHVGYGAVPDHQVILTPSHRVTHPVPVTTSPAGWADERPAIGQGAGGTVHMINPTDRVLSRRVGEHLQRYNDLAMSARNVQISARDGALTLSGVVQSERDRQMIADIARNTSGVAHVNNQLRVAAGPPAMWSQVERERDRSMMPTGRTGDATRLYAADASQLFSLHVEELSGPDRDVAQRILQGLRTDTTLSTLLPAVTINVSNGKATLMGRVHNEQQRQTIVSAVRRAAGAGNVIDELRVER
jgi:osmotically-inducible protein OsmY